jgi:NADH pyrophosphatase NudC (nudix superfamily)
MKELWDNEDNESMDKADLILRRIDEIMEKPFYYEKLRDIEEVIEKSKTDPFCCKCGKVGAYHSYSNSVLCSSCNKEFIESLSDSTIT